jgi:hypothetical protein
MTTFITDSIIKYDSYIYETYATGIFLNVGEAKCSVDFPPA